MATGVAQRASCCASGRGVLDGVRCAVRHVSCVTGINGYNMKDRSILPFICGRASEPRTPVQQRTQVPNRRVLRHFPRRHGCCATVAGAGPRARRSAGPQRCARPAHCARTVCASLQCDVAIIIGHIRPRAARPAPSPRVARPTAANSGAVGVLPSRAWQAQPHGNSAPRPLVREAHSAAQWRGQL